MKLLLKSLIVLLFLSGALSAQSFQFIAMSDSRGDDNGVNSKVLSALVNHIITTQKKAKFVLFPGDLVDGSKTCPDSTRDQLRYWRKIMQPLYENKSMIKPRVYVTVGNHEIQHRKDEESFRTIFPEAYRNGPDDEKGLTYSFDYNKCHFIFITSDRWYYGNPDDTTDDRRDWHYIKHIEWLKEDLANAKAKGSKYIFILTHEPTFPTGGHLSDALPCLGKNFTGVIDSTRRFYLNQREMFWNLCKEYNVTAHICGHEHLYDRQSVDGIFQVLAGSTGAPLYNFNPKFGETLSAEEGSFEMRYETAVPYYKQLGYHYGPGKNSQASVDFVGRKAFNYVLFDVKPDKITCTTYGAYPDKGRFSKMGTEIQVIDSFVIPGRK